jgi:hypothetical protein
MRNRERILRVKIGGAHSLDQERQELIPGIAVGESGSRFKQ